MPDDLTKLERAADAQVSEHAKVLKAAPVPAAQSVLNRSAPSADQVVANACMSAIDKDPCACKLACHIVKQQFHDICEVNLCDLDHNLCWRLLYRDFPICTPCRQRAEHCWRRVFQAHQSLHAEVVGTLIFPVGNFLLVS